MERRPGRPARRPRSLALNLELLEDRWLPSGLKVGWMLRGDESGDDKKSHVSKHQNFDKHSDKHSDKRDKGDDANEPSANDSNDAVTGPAVPPAEPAAPPPAASPVSDQPAAVTPAAVESAARATRSRSAIHKGSDNDGTKTAHESTADPEPLAVLATAPVSDSDSSPDVVPPSADDVPATSGEVAAAPPTATPAPSDADAWPAALATVAAARKLFLDSPPVPGTAAWELAAADRTPARIHDAAVILEAQEQPLPPVVGIDPNRPLPVALPAALGATAADVTALEQGLQQFLLRLEAAAERAVPRSPLGVASAWTAVIAAAALAVEVGRRHLRKLRLAWAGAPWAGWLGRGGGPPSDLS